MKTQTPPTVDGAKLIDTHAAATIAAILLVGDRIACEAARRDTGRAVAEMTEMTYAEAIDAAIDLIVLVPQRTTLR